MTDNILLGSIYGGVLLGIGLGLIFKGGASTGGTDTIGWIINKYTGWSVGIAILMVDSFVIFGGGIVYHSLEAPLIGFLNLFLSTKVIDFVLGEWTTPRWPSSSLRSEPIRVSSQGPRLGRNRLLR